MNEHTQPTSSVITTQLVYMDDFTDAQRDEMYALQVQCFADVP